MAEHPMVAWLVTQLNELEATARAASPGPWRATAEHDEVIAVDDVTVAEGFALSGQQLRATVDYIVANDPQSVLDLVAAERAMLELHRDAGSGRNYGYVEHACAVCGIADSYAMPWPCDTLRLLASGLRNRPGCDPQWLS